MSFPGRNWTRGHASERSFGRLLHSDSVESALKAHWPEESFLKDGDLWGCGLVWFARQDIYESIAWRGAVFSVLDEETVTRCLLPVRPMQRLKPYLSEEFSRFSRPKRKRDNNSPAPGQ